MVSLGCVDLAPYKWLQGHMNELLAWERLIERGEEMEQVNVERKETSIFYCAYDTLSLYLETSVHLCRVLQFLIKTRPFSLEWEILNWHYLNGIAGRLPFHCHHTSRLSRGKVYHLCLWVHNLFSKHPFSHLASCCPQSIQHEQSSLPPLIMRHIEASHRGGNWI